MRIPVGPPVRARASIVVVPVPVTVNPPPFKVTLSELILKQVSDPPDMFCVSVYVPGAASSPHVDMFPGRSTAAKMNCGVKKRSERSARYRVFLWEKRGIFVNK